MLTLVEDDNVDMMTDLGDGMGYIGTEPGRLYHMGAAYETASASGTEISVSSLEAPLKGLKVFGHSAQSGTPSPENPVDIVNAGEILTTGAQLFNINDPMDSTNFNPIFTVDGHGWIEADIPANDGGNYKYYNFFTKPSDLLETSMEYLAVCEVAELPDVTLYVSSASTASKGQVRTQFIASDSAVKVVTTASDLSDCANQMRGFLSVASGRSGGHIKFRVSLIKDTSVTLDTFVYEPYTGGVPAVYDYGEINITVSDGADQSQTLPILTEGGLLGIPVSSGGNYTDADGQQWAADYVDLTAGKRHQRVNKVVVDGETLVFVDGGLGYWRLLPEGSAPGASNIARLTNYFPGGAFGENPNSDIIFTTPSRMTPYFSTVDELNVFCAEKNAEGKPLEIYYVCDDIVTDLTEEEIEAYKTIRTYKGTTIIRNDADAWMEIEYRKAKG